VRADAGTATIAGITVDDVSGVRRLVGYLPDRTGVYPRMTAMEYLVFYAGVHGVAPRQRRTLASQLLEALDLADLAGEAVSSLAAGHLRRLALARTLVHDPPVVLLDEPLAGLDPSSQQEVMALVSDLAGMGKTMVVTARVLADLETVCTSVGVLRAGRIVATGRPDEMRSQVPGGALPELPLGAAPPDPISGREAGASSPGLLGRFAPFTAPGAPSK